MRLDFRKIEKKWQKRWDKAKIFEVNLDKKKKKFFITFPIPYVNGAPHIGTGFTDFRVDSYARFKRMQGFNVLYPQGFHATGEPIVGAIERLKENDKIQIETFKLFGATDKDLKDFVKFGAEFVAKYWMKRWIEVLKLAGFSIDWRRTFITALTHQFNRFIEWQYNSLRKKEYVIQGTHPVVWCPKDQSPTGDHDRLKGEGESPIEYVIIKFSLESGEIIPTGTLRPETMYGATNIWINPDVEYVWTNIGKEKWLLSQKAVEKLKDQLKKVRVIEKIKGKDLIGRYVNNPFNKLKMLILPASFVDPNAATGIVVSVPSHAPYDWAALVDLKKNPEQLKKYGITPEKLDEIKPIAMLKVEGFGEHPAIELYEKFGIKSQNETEKLDEATNLLYKKEYHTGILRENCGEYAGSRVSEVKERLIRDFIKENHADMMWEITGEVVCRCTTRCHVKILENQWFLKFSDQEWKNRVKELIASMKFYPEEARIQFLNTVDWLKDKACARKTGLGTKLPWDKEWIVETLSDSTIYMAYYTISRIIAEKKIKAEKLTDEVFDFIFLGRGNSKKISKDVGLKEKIIKEMREEFEYFYPVDLRNSGKDLIQNHLTYYLFHHTAVWDKKYWPKSIGINGYVNVAGTKMSKSKGNIIPLKNLIEKVGSDIVRINIVASNEGLDDADWRDESVVSYISRIEFLNDMIKKVKNAKRKNNTVVDSYLVSKIQEMIKRVMESYQDMRFRSASQSAFFDGMNELKWYIERVGGIKNCNKEILTNFLEKIILLLTPLIPHISEEFWESLGKKGFVGTAKWPEAEEKLIDKNALELEEILKKTIEDLNQIIKLAGKKKNAFIYTTTEKELKHFKQAEDYIKKRFNFNKVQIFLSKDRKKYDPQNKSAKAKYGKPGIYLE